MSSETPQGLNAIYYPSAIWTDGEWLKTALLFYGQVTVLRRDRDHRAATVLDEKLIDLLTEKNLITVADPASLITDQMTTDLREALLNKQVWNALEPIGGERRFYYGARVFSTLNGPEPSLEMMEMRNVLMERLGAGEFLDQEVGGHAYPTYRVGGQEPDLPVHIRLWAPLMAVLPQYLSTAPSGAAITAPLTNHHSGGGSLARLLDLEGMPTSGRVNTFEPIGVAPDLAGMPWSEVLELREEVGHDCYTVAELMRDAVLAPSEAIREELEQTAYNTWRRLSGLVGRRPVFQIGAVGASWDASGQGEPHQLAALARVLGGGSNSAWTAVFRSGESIVNPTSIDS